jgi:esterase/lipase superfamily enzyme
MMDSAFGPSRRGVLRALASAASTLALGGCGSLVSATAVRFDAAELSANPVLLVATTRKAVNGASAKPWFGHERARLSIARARLTPPDQGRFSLRSVGLSHWRFDALEPVPQFSELLGEVAGPRDVLLYVHGFNQTFEAAALDAAHLSEGIGFRGETMLFSWPSKAKLFDYGYDRESAMWSRDALEQVIAALITSPAVGRIHVVAHSIGAMLTMEALRQIYARYGAAAAERVGAVVFAAPDVDMDVFSSSVERVGYLAPKITLITSSYDRALKLSGWLTGITRVGAAETAALKRLGLRVIDASQQGWGLINHDLFLSNAQIRQVIRRAVDGRPVDGA